MSIASMIAKGGTTLTHERQDSEQRDAIGGRRMAWIELAAAVACWAQDAGGGIVEEYGRLDLRVSHSIYVERDLAVRANDRLTIGATRYLVRGVRNMAGMGRLWRIDADEVR